MEDQSQTMQSGLDEIREDWLSSSMHEKRNYVLELDEMAVDAREIQGTIGARLVHDVGLLRDDIERHLPPAPPKLDDWPAEDWPTEDRPAAANPG